MTTELDSYPKGQTLDNGRYIFVSLLRGVPHEGLWCGERLLPTRKEVLITFKSLCYTRLLDSWLRFDAPGIARLLYIGFPDGYQHPKAMRRPDQDIAVVDEKPQGVNLGDAGRLSPSEVVRLGLSLCDTIQTCAGQGNMTSTLHPEAIYVTGDRGKRWFTGAVTRATLLLPVEGMYRAFSSGPYHAPEVGLFDTTLAGGVFSAGLIMWFALLGEHAYDSRDRDKNMWNDIRRPFTGPPELGRILERVLVCDVERRMKADELRGELERLARAWNVELPPFPPPGLAAP